MERKHRPLLGINSTAVIRFFFRRPEEAGPWSHLLFAAVRTIIPGSLRGRARVRHSRFLLLHSYTGCDCRSHWLHLQWSWDGIGLSLPSSCFHHTPWNVLNEAGGSMLSVTRCVCRQSGEGAGHRGSTEAGSFSSDSFVCVWSHGVSLLQDRGQGRTVN